MALHDSLSVLRRHTLHPKARRLYIFFTPALSAFTPALSPAFHTPAIAITADRMDGLMDALYLFLIIFFALTAFAFIQGLAHLGEMS